MPRPGRARRRPGVGDPGDDRAALDRAGDRLPLAARPRGRAHRRRRRPGALRRPLAGQAAAMRAHAVRLPRDLLPAAWGSARRAVAAELAPGWPRTSRPAGWPTTGRRGSTPPRPRCSAASPTAAALPAPDAPRGGARARMGRIAWPRTGLRRPSRSPPGAPRLGVEALVVRGRNGGHWRISRPRVDVDAALAGEEPVRCPPGRGTPRWSPPGSRRSAPGRPPTSSGGSAAPPAP